MTTLLQAAGVSKRFGATVALDDVRLTINHGAIHGLLGKNGAGKSTLVNVLAGSVRPDVGTVTFDGTDVTGLDLAGRRERGITLLPQHPQLFDDLTVTENLLLGELPIRSGLVSWRVAHRRAADRLGEFDLDIDPRAICRRLDASDRRRLAIVQSLGSGGQLILLDEPTASLKREEREAFFAWITKLNRRGRTFVFISHFISEIQAVCTEYTVMRDGRVSDVGTDPGSSSAAQLSRQVVGADVEQVRRVPQDGGRPLLQLEGFATRGLAPFDLTVAAGEVVGLAGLAGSGGTAAARAIAGLQPRTSGTLRLDGRTIRASDVAGLAAAGIAYLTSDRQAEGIVPHLGAGESMVLGVWPRRGQLINRRAIESNFARMRDRLSVAVGSASQPIATLSGGNQQKVLFARVLAARPKVVILDEPTHGVDVGTKEEIHRLVDDLAASGVGVLLLAYDTEEMVRMVDRVVAFRDGRMCAELSGATLDTDRVLQAVAGPEREAAARPDLAKR